jgi:hypothetical protein
MILEDPHVSGWRILRALNDALRPDPAAAQVIERIAVSAAAVVGDHRWVAGAVSRRLVSSSARCENRWSWT